MLSNWSMDGRSGCSGEKERGRQRDRMWWRARASPLAVAGRKSKNHGNDVKTAKEPFNAHEDVKVNSRNLMSQYFAMPGMRVKRALNLAGVPSCEEYGSEHNSILRVPGAGAAQYHKGVCVVGEVFTLFLEKLPTVEERRQQWNESHLRPLATGNSR